MKPIAVLLALACTTAGAQQLSCTTPAVTKTVKMIVAENVIAVAEREMAIRFSLDRETPQAEIDSAKDKLTSAIQIRNARRIEVSATNGFPVWCTAETVVVGGPPYPISIEYRARPSSDHADGVHTQAKAKMPQGLEGFNALIAMRRTMVLLIR